MTATDTLRTAETLREAGVPERQAVAHARATDDAVTEATAELVTREYLRAELANLRLALVLWGIGIATAAVGVLVAVLR